MTCLEPVVLFVFNRPDHTRQVWSQIRIAQPKKLLVLADGSREDIPGEKERTEQVRRIVTEIDWPCDVRYQFSDHNLGLRQSFLKGLDLAFELFDRAIILEDDCVPTLDFFSFASELLNRYENESRVGSVAGSNFAPRRGEFSYHFSRAPYIWGWATWARVWKAFRASKQVEAWSKEEERALHDSFSHPQEKKSFIGMMKSAKFLNTWDISFSVWFRQKGLLCAIPEANLVGNIGFGEAATHTFFEPFDIEVSLQSMEVKLSHPNLLVANMRHERSRWRSKTWRWITFPVRHPLDFCRRFFQFVGLKLKKRMK